MKKSGQKNKSVSKNFDNRWYVVGILVLVIVVAFLFTVFNGSSGNLNNFIGDKIGQLYSNSLANPTPQPYGTPKPPPSPSPTNTASPTPTNPQSPKPTVTPDPKLCGNGKVDSGEECDGTDYCGKNCLCAKTISDSPVYTCSTDPITSEPIAIETSEVDIIVPNPEKHICEIKGKKFVKTINRCGQCRKCGVIINGDDVSIGCAVDSTKDTNNCDIHTGGISDAVKKKCNMLSITSKCSSGDCFPDKCKNIKSPSDFKDATGIDISLCNNDAATLECMKNICSWLSIYPSKHFIKINITCNLAYPGLYDPDTGTIYININFCQKNVVDHEIGHTNTMDSPCFDQWPSTQTCTPKELYDCLNRSGSTPCCGYVNELAKKNQLEDMAEFIEMMQNFPDFFKDLIGPGSTLSAKEKKIYLDRLALLYNCGAKPCEDYYNILEKSGINITPL